MEAAGDRGPCGTTERECLHRRLKTVDVLRRNRGCFTAIGIAVVLVLATAVPNFLQAISRSRQKRSMAGIRDWAGKIETAYPGHHGQANPVSAWSTELEEFARRHKLPTVDGWGRPFRITMGADSYVVRSAGRDGVYEKTTPFGPTSTFDEDMVFSDGAWIRYPEGL
jgi:hypothetical protein